MRVEFICERCGVESHIETGESIYEDCEKIRVEHAKWSPECMGDLSTIRLVPAIAEMKLTEGGGK